MLIQLLPPTFQHSLQSLCPVHTSYRWIKVRGAFCSLVSCFYVENPKWWQHLNCDLCVNWDHYSNVFLINFVHINGFYYIFLPFLLLFWLQFQKSYPSEHLFHMCDALCWLLDFHYKLTFFKKLLLTAKVEHCSFRLEKGRCKGDKMGALHSVAGGADTVRPRPGHKSIRGPQMRKTTIPTITPCQGTV